MNEREDDLWRRLGAGSETETIVHTRRTTMLNLYYRVLDAVSGGRLYHAHWMSKLGIPPVPAWAVEWFFNFENSLRRNRR